MIDKEDFEKYKEYWDDAMKEIGLLKNELNSIKKDMYSHEAKIESLQRNERDTTKFITRFKEVLRLLRL